MTAAKTRAERQVLTLRAEHLAGRTPRYIVRCGLEAFGRVQVHDCAGDWVCSTHKTLALTWKRCDELNAKAQVA